MSAGIRKVVGGIVGGSLGGAVCAGLYGAIGGLLGSPLLDEAALPVDGAFVLSTIVIGVAYGLIAGQIFQLLPGGFIARVAVLFAMSAGGELAVGFPVMGLGFAGLSAGGATGLITVLIAFGAYATVLGFVLRQTLTLPLPLWQPLRRSDEFKDNPAGSH